jgi:hypothetical protein
MFTKLGMDVMTLEAIRTSLFLVCVIGKKMADALSREVETTLAPLTIGPYHI